MFLAIIAISDHLAAFLTVLNPECKFLYSGFRPTTNVENMLSLHQHSDLLLRLDTILKDQAINQQNLANLNSSGNLITNTRSV